MFLFAFSFFAWSRQVAHPRAKAGGHRLLEGHQVALPGSGESSLSFANPPAFQIQAAAGEGGRGSSVRSLPSLAVTLGAASADTAPARGKPCAVPSGPTLAR